MIYNAFVTNNSKTLKHIEQRMYTLFNLEIVEYEILNVVEETVNNSKIFVLVFDDLKESIQDKIDMFHNEIEERISEDYKYCYLAVYDNNELKLSCYDLDYNEPVEVLLPIEEETLLCEILD